MEGAFPFSRSYGQEREMGICHLFQQVPASGFVEGAEHEYFLGIILTPKDTRPFEAQINHPANCAFDGPTADGQLQRPYGLVSHPLSILNKIIPFRHHRLAVSPATKHLDGLHHLIDVSRPQPTALGSDPGVALLS